MGGMKDTTTYPLSDSVPRPNISAKRFQQFMDRVHKDAETGCWLWEGKPNPMGYGVASYKGRSLYAHRLSWVIFCADLARGRYIHHKCRNRLCVNPDHLECLTAEEHVDRHLSARTHCSNGHLLTPEITYVYPGSHKILCRDCKRKWGAEYYLRTRKLAEPRPQPSHCRNGHEYTEENIYMFRGVRCCRECHRVNSLAYVHRRRDAAKDLALTGDAPKRTHCRYGHEFTDENTMLVHRHNGVTSRRCRTCDAAYKKAHHELKYGK